MKPFLSDRSGKRHLPLLLAGLLFLCSPPGGLASPASDPPSQIRTFSLTQCLDLAFERNHTRPASRYAVTAAEAQHRQALASYWPQFNVRGSYQRLDESPDFLFPSAQYATPGGTMYATVPGLGTLPIKYGATSVKVPQQDVKLMDPDTFLASGNVTWLLYDGGLRQGYREQTQAGVDAARQESRRTDLQLADSVKRLYYGAVLARQLQQLGRDTLARLETTLNLTETMYKETVGKVTKADFLETKVTVESLRALVAGLEKNQAMAQAALANTMGLTWKESIQPASAEIPFEPYAAELDQMVGTAYQFNPDWARLEAGIRAAEGALKTARSGHYPKLAVSGEIHRWWNDYDAGVATDRNKDGWSVTVGVEIPVFDGFLARNKVKEAAARAGKIREEKILLEEGLGLQIKDIFLGLEAARKSCLSTREALKAAEENRALNTRAYQDALVETEKVLRAQLMEAITSAAYFKIRFDHAALQSQLNLVVGTEVWKRLSTGP